MKKIILILFALFIGLNVYSQRRGNMNGIPQANREPSKQEIAKYKRLVEERKNEYIANFLTTLEADDFVICQSNAIGRFVARELSLYGANSQEQAIIDQVCETLNDVGNELIRIFFLGLDEEARVSNEQ